MASEDLTIQGAIKFTLDRVGLKNAQDELKRVAGAAGQAAPAVRKVGDAATYAGKAFDPMRIGIGQVKSLLLSTFGAGALYALTTSSVEEFGKIRTAIGGIEKDLQRLGPALVPQT